MDKKQEIEKLYKDRKKLIDDETFKDVGMDNALELPSNLYAEKGHYIYELLQNADDAGAKTVAIDLTENAIEVKYDGRSFNHKDFQSIISFGKSTKKDELNKIGKFGLGFKSVFGITDSPEIYSGGYQFGITEFILPHWLNTRPGHLKHDATLIRLPFRKEEQLAENTRGQLNDLTAECILFLRHITHIDIRHNGESIREIDRDKISKKYHREKSTVDIDGQKLEIAIAFAKNSKGEIKEKEKDIADLFCYFPVEKETTGLKFLVHAPYKTISSRETIGFEDAENRQLSQALAALVVTSLEELKAAGDLTVDVLTLLPLDSENNHDLYSTIHNEVKEAFRQRRLLPAMENSDERLWGKADEVLIADQKLHDLLQPADCKTLFGKAYFLHRGITEDRTRGLYTFLKSELGIKHIHMSNFLEKINKSFIKDQTDDWLIKFYGSADISEKWLLKTKPIIRLDDDKLACPNENDVYLPADGKSRFRTVKKCLVEDEAALEFLKNLGLKKPDVTDEIKQFIVPKYRDENPQVEDKDYRDDFKRVLECYQSASSGDQTKIVNLLKDCWFIACTDQHNKRSYQCAEDVYFENETTKMWFAGNPDIHFLSPDIADLEGSDGFLRASGVRKEPDIKDNFKPHWNGRHYIRGIDGFNPKFEIEGLAFALKHIKFERSVYLFKLLLDYPEKIKGFVEWSTRQNFAREESSSYGKEKEKQPSEVGKSLSKTEHWLYGPDKVLIEKPIGDILLGDLHGDYNRGKTKPDALVKALGLKLDDEKEFENKHPDKKVVNAKEYEKQAEENKELKEKIERLEKEAEARKKASESAPRTATDTPSYTSGGGGRSGYGGTNGKRSYTPTNDIHEEAHLTTPTWEPEVLPEQPPLSKQPYIPPEYKDLSSPFQQARPASAASDTPTGGGTSPSPVDLKKIGEWSEQYAARWIREQHPGKEIINMNEGGTGEGYDIVVREDGEDLHYYEVKGKTGYAPKSFDITGHQWGWARQQRERYTILVVSDAGKENARVTPINDPAGLFEQGKLAVDVLAIKL